MKTYGRNGSGVGLWDAPGVVEPLEPEVLGEFIHRAESVQATVAAAP
jgi:hypothetical protein